MKKFLIIYFSLVGVLVISKAAGLIMCSWVWVIAPIWVPVVLLFLLLLTIFFIYGDEIEDGNDFY